jgi:FtsZ-interacting cell division protein ZipA
MKESSSHLLINNCDEFIYYEDLERPLGTPPAIEQDLPAPKKEAFQLLLDSVEALVRENKEVLWSSMVKETMKRKKPSFNESYHGYRTFSDLLEDAESKGLIRLRTDTRSGTYVVVGFGKEKKKEEGKEEPQETKERPERKVRKTQKPRWRPRTRQPKPEAPPVTTEAASASASETTATEPVPPELIVPTGAPVEADIPEPETEPIPF